MVKLIIPFEQLAPVIQKPYSVIHKIVILWNIHGIVFIDYVNSSLIQK